MKLRWVIGTMCVMLAAMTWVRGEDKPAAPADQAKPAAAEKKPASGRMAQPWSKMSSLSEEQKDKIKAIHAKALEEIKAIRDKERADIVALLTDDQKNELKSVEEKAMAERKSNAAARKEAAAESAAAPAAPAMENKGTDAAK